MADFRKSFFVLAALVLILGASAFGQQSLQCQANAGVPPILRAEGLTEIVGDIVLNCTGGTPTAAGVSIPQANIQVFLNTAVTSRLVSATQAESILILDDQAPATQFLCGSTNGCTYAGTAGVVTAYSALRPSVYQGQVNGNQSVLFLGVPIDPPGSTGTRIIRVTNLRANASAVAPGGSGTPGQVAALISASPQNVLPINNPQQIVGYVQVGQTFNVKNVGNTGGLGNTGLAQCSSLNTSTTSRAATGLLEWVEGFATSWKTRAANFDATGATSPAPPVAGQAIPGVNVTTAGITAATETGFYNPALTAPYNIAGLADYGTRVQAVFNNIPSGMNIFVGVRELTSGTTYSTAGTKAVLVTFDSAAFLPVAPIVTTILYQNNGATFAAGVAQLTVTNASATATWEITANNALAVETLDVPFWLNYSASAANNTPALGTGTINGRFAPISTTNTASQTASVPRFVDTSKAISSYTVRQCITNLLFPYVTNQAGFDTGIAIANTTTDPFGTTPQTGTCALNFYGDSAPSALTSPAVASGTVWTTLASTSSPNFQGYVIAVCKYQYAHGFAFVSDLGARTIAMGYLAGIMPDQGRINSGTTPGAALSTGTGELLGN
jgi:hypothetical protein